MLLIEIIIIIGLIFLNGYFALAEIALLSVKKSRLSVLAKQGNKKAKKALILTRRYPDMLSTIQIAITTIGIFAGAFGGATVAKHLEKILSNLEPLAEYSDVISVAFVVISITYLSLVIGELVPKQMALAKPEKLSLKVAGVITTLMRIVMPFVKLLSSSTTIALKLLHIKPAQEQIITEDEIKALIAEGVESGAFEKIELKIVENIFNLGNRPIKDFMTPYNDIDWVSINDSLTKIRQIIKKSDSTVLPIYKDESRESIGAIEINDILNAILSEGSEKFDLKSIIQPVMHFDSDLPSLIAIDRLKKSSVKIAVIEHRPSNHILGVISFHDVLEALAGEFRIKQQ